MGPIKQELLAEHSEINAPVFARLEEAGVGPGERHLVRYLFFGAAGALRKAKAHLVAVGLSAKIQHGMLVVTEIMPVEEDTLAERTAFMNLMAERHGVDFDGWEVGLGDAVADDLDLPPKGYRDAEPGAVHALPLGTGKFGFVHVVAARRFEVIGNVLQFVADEPTVDVDAVLSAPVIYRQPVQLTPHLWQFAQVGKRLPDAAAINRSGLYFKQPLGPDLLFDRMIARGLIDLDARGPHDLSPEAIAAYRERECAFLASTDRIEASEWILRTYSVTRTGKLRGPTEETVSASDPRLKQAYPHLVPAYPEDLRAALGGGGFDRLALYDRIYTT